VKYRKITGDIIELYKIFAGKYDRQYGLIHSRLAAGEEPWTTCIAYNMHILGTCCPLETGRLAQKLQLADRANIVLNQTCTRDCLGCKSCALQMFKLTYFLVSVNLDLSK